MSDPPPTGEPGSRSPTGEPSDRPASGEFGYVTPGTLALFTDRYEASMLRGYRETGHDPTATFQLFVRDLPANRGYLLAAGLEQVVHYVSALSFGDDALDALAETGFPAGFLDWLADWEFTGEVRAIPEGTPVFRDEPLLEVTAPISQAQLFETLVINQVGFGTLAATKAARMVDAVRRFGDGQALVDFGSRRAHGTDAGMKAARSAYLAGFDGTSNLAAGDAFGVPTYGTMAHSWVQSFESERAAFEAFVDTYGEDSVLLVDTYDTVEGARTARAVAEDRGVDLAGVRLDSGDLVALSREVGEVLPDTDVFVSSGVDEFFLREFLGAGGVADGFGPGTALVTSDDAPKLDAVYKLVAVERDGELAPSMKLSPGKVTYPGRKRVYRVEEGGEHRRDVLAERGEDVGGGGGVGGVAGGEDVAGDDLLVTVFEDGDLVYDLPDLDEIRERARAEVAKLPEGIRAFEDPDEYEVAVSDGLAATTDAVRESLERG